MNDLISRQDAIDALERKKDKNAKGDVGVFYNKIIQNDIDALMQLPSAKPTFARDINVPNKDCISRQDAIESIRKLPNAGIHWFVSAEAVFDVLLKLPCQSRGEGRRTKNETGL